MLLSICVVTLASLLAWLYLRWSKVRSFWAERNVPHQPPHPIWGSLTFLQQINVGLWLKDMYSRSPAYAGIWLFWRPALIINHPELGRKILFNTEVFADRFLSSGRHDPFGSLNLFTVKNPLWSTLRSNLTPVMTLMSLRSLHGLLLLKSKHLVQRIKADTEDRKIINLRLMYSDYTTDVIGTATFGIDSNATVTGESQLRTVTKGLMRYSISRGMAWSSIFFFPKLVDIFGFSMFPKQTTDYFRKVYNSIAKHHSIRGNNKTYLVEALLKIQQKLGITNEDINEDTMTAQATFFLQIGFDTCAITMTFATYELAYHLEAQDKLYNEIKELKQRLGDKEFNCDDLVNLTYMTCVINETLRKYPPMGFLDRIAAKDYKIDETLTIPEGTPVYVNAIGMHFDPKYFPDPEKFNPDRFLPENEKNIPPNAFLPFGDGPRNCIGQHLAQLTIRYALASTLLNFQVRPLPGTPKPNACEIETSGILTAPSGMMPVEFVPRREELVF